MFATGSGVFLGYISYVVEESRSVGVSCKMLFSS